MDMIYVACPALGGGKLVSISETCEKCRFMVAIGVTNEDERLEWTERHTLICNYPRRLQIAKIESTETAIKTVEGRSVSKAVDNG